MDLFAKRISKSMWCLLGIILFIILFSLISPYLAPDDPYLTHSDNILAAPVLWAVTSAGKRMPVLCG